MFLKCSSSLPLKDAEFAQSHLLEPVLERGFEHAQSVNGAPLQVDGGCFLVIAGGTGDLSDLETGVEDLGDHLVVEYKILGVQVVIDASQDLPGKSPESGVVFG